MFHSGRVKALLLASLFLGLAGGVVSSWDYDNEVAHYRRSRTIRSLRVNDAESGHELSLAVHAAAHDPVVHSTVSTSAGTDDPSRGGEAPAGRSTPAPPPAPELRLEANRPPAAPSSYEGFSEPLRGPPSLS